MIRQDEFKLIIDTLTYFPHYFKRKCIRVTNDNLLLILGFQRVNTDTEGT